jgi:ABC-type amino acid transport substrate-binding protein
MKSLIILVLSSVLMFNTVNVNAKSSMLRVGVVTGSSPAYKLPFAGKGHFGQYNGIAVKLWKHVAKKNGYQYKFIQIKSNYKKAINDLSAGKYDVLVGAISVTSERKRIVDFSRSFFDNEVAIAMNSSHENLPIIGKILANEELLLTIFKDKRLSVAKNTSTEILAKEISNLVLPEKSLYAAMVKLAYNKTTAVIGDRVMMGVVLDKNRKWRFEVFSKAIKSEGYAFVLPFKSPLLKKINMTLDKLTTGKWREMCKAYDPFVPKSMKFSNHCKIR